MSVYCVEQLLNIPATSQLYMHILSTGVYTVHLHSVIATCIPVTSHTYDASILLLLVEVMVVV